MKRTIGSRNEIVITVRTESGKVEMEIGLDSLSRAERRLLFSTVGMISKGGTVGFGLTTTDAGDKDLTFRITEPTVGTAVRNALQ